VIQWKSGSQLPLKRNIHCTAGSQNAMFFDIIFIEEEPGCWAPLSYQLSDGVSEVKYGDKGEMLFQLCLCRRTTVFRLARKGTGNKVNRKSLAGTQQKAIQSCY
jgi:hypothetical protein